MSLPHGAADAGLWPQTHRHSKARVTRDTPADLPPRPDAPTVDSAPSIAHLAARALARIKDHVMWRVNGATARQRTAILAAGERINAIVNHARSQVQETQQQLAALSDDADHGPSLLESIQAQATTVRRFVDRLTVDIAQQSRTATLAVQSVERIAEVGAKMDGVARETRVVAFNAALEAVRLGEQGRPMQVIATELRRLNGEVQELNGIVTAMTADLRSVLPNVDEIAREIAIATQRFATQASTQSEHIATQSTALRQTVTDLLATGDSRLQVIVDAAYEALSQLQFQDPVQQDLELIETDLDKAIAFTEAFVGSGGDLEAAKPTLQGGLHRSHTRGLREEHIVVDDSGATVEAGEVLLF